MRQAFFPTKPVAVPVPERLLLFSPHPDDIAISLGAFAALVARWSVPTTIVLVTDGSEARLPENVLVKYGGSSLLPPEQQRELRGRIRVAEATIETTRLGIPSSSVRLLSRQRWFSQHRTSPQFLHPDLSLRDVDQFQPGPMDIEAIQEVSDIIGTGADTICAVPDASDRLEMHRITTAIVNRTRGRASLLTYECLSTIEVTGPQTIFAFDADLMAIKCRAIRAHESMLERRRQFGGYSNPGSEFYDDIVRRKNSELAQMLGLDLPYAERFGWLT